jgi:hypothetical protein
MTAFFIPYAVGCELWAPWSEEIGRWPVMQIGLGLTNVSVIICARKKLSRHHRRKGTGGVEFCGWECDDGDGG